MPPRAVVLKPYANSVMLKPAREHIPGLWTKKRWVFYSKTLGLPDARRLVQAALVGGGKRQLHVKAYGWILLRIRQDIAATVSVNVILAFLF
jgi:hypothetical protein